jgi:hypothetical protein
MTKTGLAKDLHYICHNQISMCDDNHTEELREALRKKYHSYVQISTQFQMMGKGPHRVQLYEQVVQATKEWKLAQQQFLYHLRQRENGRMVVYL